MLKTCAAAGDLTRREKRRVRNRDEPIIERGDKELADVALSRQALAFT
jgi:hypothetical protein